MVGRNLSKIKDFFGKLLWLIEWLDLCFVNYVNFIIFEFYFMEY